MSVIDARYKFKEHFLLYTLKLSIKILLCNRRQVILIILRRRILKLIFFRSLFILPFCLVLSCKSSTSSLELGKSNETIQYSRFDPWLDQLDDALNPKGNANFDEIAKELVDGSSRAAAFNLQALARLYESKNKIYQKLFLVHQVHLYSEYNL